MIQFITQTIFWLPYFGTTIVLVALFGVFVFKNNKFHRWLNISVLLVIAFFLLAWMSQLLSLYLSVQALPDSESFLHGPGSFFTQKSLAVSQSYISTFVVTVLLYITTLVLRKFQKKPYLNNFTPKVVLITALSLGFSNVLPLILVALILAIFFQIFYYLKRQGGSDRADMVPFLLLGAIIIRVLMIFPLYSQLLGFLHLI